MAKSMITYQNKDVVEPLRSCLKLQLQYLRQKGGVLDSVDKFSFACLPAGRSTDSKIYT